MRVLFSLLLTISFAAAAQSKKQKGDSSIPLPNTEPTVVKPAAAPAAAVPAASTPPPATKADDVLPLPMAGPELPALDLSLLKDTSLCIFPFVKESSAGAADKQYLDAIQKTFFDVAKDSPLLKDAVLLGDSTSKC